METNQTESPSGFCSLSAWLKSDAGREGAPVRGECAPRRGHGGGERKEGAGGGAELDGQNGALTDSRGE